MSATSHNEVRTKTDLRFAPHEETQEDQPCVKEGPKLITKLKPTDAAAKQQRPIAFTVAIGINSRR